MKKILGLVLIVLFVSGISAPLKRERVTMIIKSPVFKNQEYIPKKYTGEGQDVNPPLIFENVPKDSKSLVLIVDDPDAPFGVFNHWIVFNIEGKIREIKEGEAPKGSLFGKNSFGKLLYGGPYPPPGKPHRYFFKLYALNTVLTLKEGASKKEIEKAVEGHILSQAVLIGLYKR